MNLSFYVWCSQQKGRTLHFDEDVLKEKPQNQYKAHSGGKMKRELYLPLCWNQNCYRPLEKERKGRTAERLLREAWKYIR
uniref:Uncharacterized protein n=2 Tax=Haplochromini TaxID=319058 RepID=A0A3B4GCG2_9CICH